MITESVVQQHQNPIVSTDKKEYVLHKSETLANTKNGVVNYTRSQTSTGNSFTKEVFTNLKIGLHMF